jgi:4-aminobutyrate aminotransferase-like enzyme
VNYAQNVLFTEYQLAKLPHPEDLKLLEKLRKYEPRSFTEHQLPIVWNYATDCFVFDRYWDKFIDFSSGIFVTNTGHSNICTAIMDQMDMELVHSYTFPTEIRLEYLKELTKFTGYEKAFLLSGGSEAVEVTCKIMRLATKKRVLLSFEGSMHGKTGLAENLRGASNWVTPDPYICRLPFPKPYEHFLDLLVNNYFEKIEDIAGIMIESYRGWDAEFFHPLFIQELIKWAKQNNILVCFDEIQSGFGRTGKLFCYEHYKVKPDLVCCGKGIGGGVPLSAVLGSQKLLDIPNDLSSTNSGNPLVCATGLEVIKIIKERNLIKETARKGKIMGFLDQFISYDKIVKKVNYCGLVGAIITKTVEQANEICIKALQEGLIVVKTGRESVKLGPALTIPDETLREGLQILCNIIERMNDGL